MERRENEIEEAELVQTWRMRERRRRGGGGGRDREKKRRRGNGHKESFKRKKTVNRWCLREWEDIQWHCQFTPTGYPSPPLPSIHRSDRSLQIFITVFTLIQLIKLLTSHKKLFYLCNAWNWLNGNYGGRTQGWKERELITEGKGKGSGTVDRNDSK